jgi:hypothetical protein
MNVIDAQLNYWDTSLHFKREVSCFITPQHGIISLTTGLVEETDAGLAKTKGCGGAVDFDWDKIWGFLRKQDVKPDKVIMIHTHPANHDSMSSTDLNMCQGWRLALGVPIDFQILTQFPFTGNCEGVVAHYKVDRNSEKKITISEKYAKSVDIHSLDLVVVYEVLYGMSKAPELTHEDVNKIENTLKEASLRF